MSEWKSFTLVMVPKKAKLHQTILIFSKFLFFLKKKMKASCKIYEIYDWKFREKKMIALTAVL